MFTFVCLGITAQNGTDYHLFQTPHLEEGFEAIADKARQGWLLQEVCVLDLAQGEGNWIELPASAFDCQAIRPAIERLQMDWKAWLSG